jgi:hypothetical protein
MAVALRVYERMVQVESVYKIGCPIHAPEYKRNLRVATRRGPARPKAPWR